MDKELDMKLYNDYLNGDVSAFEMLYLKYKDKIKYFVFNIVKDYDKAEDITQETFTYILQNRVRDDCSFKYYIYLIAKSRAITYMNTEKRRNDIAKKYLSKEDEKIEKDVADIISKQEEKRELLKAIDMLNENYRNAIYLVKIEGLSCKEVAEILDISLQNVKNLIHRGKKELRKILIRKGFEDMNRSMKTFIIVLLVGLLLSGAVYAAVKIIENMKGKAEMTPTFTSQISEIDTNKVWVGTFNLVWNDFMNEVIKGPIEFDDGYSKLADELNKQTFTKEQLSDSSYYKKYGVATYELKNEIEKGIKQKFNEDSKILERVEWGNPDVYVLYAILKKKFNYLERFPELPDDTFGNSEEKVKYFGIKPDTHQTASKNVEILFYNSKEDFAVKLKTKEGEEVILYKTTGENKSFEENYEELKEKQSKYSGETTFKNEKDILKIPYIKVNDEINYDELCGRMIKGSDYYIRQALQTIDFELNNYGGSVKSEALIEALKNAILEKGRELIFDSDFILYLKEESKDKPYFALKVDNTDVLVAEES